MSSGTTFGSIGIALDSWPKKATPKLAAVGNDPEQRFYLLATYCFDAARKLEYVYKATRRYALEADPALAAEIKHDNDALSAAGTDWKKMAETAESILRRLLEETAEDHEKILNLLVRAKR